MPPHQTDPRIDSCPELQPSSDATPCLWHGDVEGIHEGRALRQRQGKPFFSFFFWWKKAYMPIDANHISNSKLESRVQRVRAKPTFFEA